MILRPHYLDILRTYRDVPLVKILAGIRRSGKSTILEMWREDLVGSGIAQDHIISMRYTSENLEEGMTSKKMYQGIKKKITDDASNVIKLRPGIGIVQQSAQKNRAYTSKIRSVFLYT